MPCSSHPLHLHSGRLRGDVGVKSRAARCHHLRQNVLPHEFAASHSHVVVMQHVEKEVIDNFIAELENRSGSTPNVKACETKKEWRIPLYNKLG